MSTTTTTASVGSAVAPPKEPTVLLTKVRQEPLPMQPGETRVVYTAYFQTPTGAAHEEIATVSYIPEWEIRPYIVAFKGEDPRETGKSVQSRYALFDEARQRAREALGEWAAGCLSWEFGE